MVGFLKENINNLTIALKYVRLSSLTKIEDIADFVQYNWKLDLRSPKLLISVLNSKIQSETNKKIYIDGLVKASVDAGNRQPKTN